MIKLMFNTNLHGNLKLSLPVGLLTVQRWITLLSIWGACSCVLFGQVPSACQVTIGHLPHLDSSNESDGSTAVLTDDNEKAHQLVFIQSPKAQDDPNPAFAIVEDVAGLPRVLLIGDSISIGYTVPVRNALLGKANVHRPKTNCGPTITAIAAIDEWLGDSPWDVIHFNWGLHDLKYMGPEGQNLADPNSPNSYQQVPPELYEKNLEQLVERLKKTGAKLIWRNTTPIPEGSNGRVVGDCKKYNTIAERVMQRHGVEIHDLHEFVRKRQNEIMLPANVHFTKEGYDALAQDVAAVITKAIETRESME